MAHSGSLSQCFLTVEGVGHVASALKDCTSLKTLVCVLPAAISARMSPADAMQRRKVTIAVPAVFGATT